MKAERGAKFLPGIYLGGNSWYNFDCPGAGGRAQVLPQFFPAFAARRKASAYKLDETEGKEGLLWKHGLKICLIFR